MSNTQSKPLILVDGSSYLYRAFHALPQLMNSSQMPTGATYGIINMLKKLKADYEPTHMVVVFDPKGETFRDALYPAYKAHREAMPADLAKQIEPIHAIIKALGFPILMLDGFEADDVIGTLAKQASAHGEKTIISTGDKDLAQLVNQDVTLINTMSGSLLDEAGVKEKFGVRPDQIIDYLTLVGDTSDNIPGVPQVGPKTAAKWLTEYETLDALVKHADNIKGKVGDNFKAHLSQLPLTKTLVTIKCDVPLPYTHDDLKLQPEDNDALIQWFKTMEFKSWLAERLNGSKKTLETSNEKHYDTIFTEAQLEAWVKKIKHAKFMAFDTETTSLEYMNARIVGMSFSVEAHHAAYLPFGHSYLGVPQQLSEALVWKHMKPILEDKTILKVGQNIKYDLEVLANAGVTMQGVQHDTMLESYVIDSTSNAHDMESLALKYLGAKTIPFSEVAGKGAKQITFDQVSIETAAPYAAEDADITLQLHHALWPKVSAHAGIQHIYETIEMPLVSVLVTIERNGVKIDPDKLRQQGKELQKRLVTLEDQAFTMAGKQFNMNSPKQLQSILFEDLNLPILQKTPTGQASTADAVLQELAQDFELPQLIIEYRSLSKLISTYTSKLVQQINAKTGRVHTSYNQTGAATGRLSSSDPNLQNIPVRTQEGRRIRQAFVAAPGKQLVSADYSQIELRLMAHISQDKNLLSAFQQNLDIHAATAAEVWGVPLADVTQSMRRDAKAINFGLIYGMSAFGLTKQLGIDRKAAQDYIDKYFTRYPGVHQYMENTRQHAHEKGYVETLWGRRLYLPDINASQMMRKKAAERAAINAPLQGSAADLIKMAMLNIHHWMMDENIPAKMIMQVHDELVFEVDENALENVMDGVRERMSKVVTLHVPLLVSIGHGDNWDAASAH
ncbi:MAG TPA: DNA polymerase I [Gammaproteobacteria bacterium]|nr:DNA polymerase I [Gammaproteobacteria bacterium]